MGLREIGELEGGEKEWMLPKESLRMRIGEEKAERGDLERAMDMGEDLLMLGELWSLRLLGFSGDIEIGEDLRGRKFLARCSAITMTGDLGTKLGVCSDEEGESSISMIIDCVDVFEFFVGKVTPNF